MADETGQGALVGVVGLGVAAAVAVEFAQGNDDRQGQRLGQTQVLGDRPGFVQADGPGHAAGDEVQVGGLATAGTAGKHQARAEGQQAAHVQRFGLLLRRSGGRPALLFALRSDNGRQGDVDIVKGQAEHLLLPSFHAAEVEAAVALLDPGQIAAQSLVEAGFVQHRGSGRALVDVANGGDAVVVAEDQAAVDISLDDGAALLGSPVARPLQGCATADAGLLGRLLRFQRLQLLLQGGDLAR